MLESLFERLGRELKKNSGKIIIAWIIALIVLAPFSLLFFKETTYNLAGDISPPSSMYQHAQKLLSLYFSSSSTSQSSSGPSLIVITTGTDMNDAGVIGTYIKMQNSVLSYLRAEGIGGSITSALSIEKGIMTNITDAARTEVNITYQLASSMEAGLIQLNNTSADTLDIIYGIPSLFLDNFMLSNSSQSAYNATVEELHPMNSIEKAYLNSFYTFWNNTRISDAYQRASYAIGQAVLNSTSEYNSIIVRDQQLYELSLSIYSNFTLSDFNLDTPANLSHYMSYSFSYSSGVLLPSLEANREAVIFLSAELNVTPSQFFSDTFNATWNRTPIQALTDSLVQKGMISYFYDNPEVEINSYTIGSYIEQINESSNLSALEDIRLQATGFSGYPAIPSPYIYHQFVGYDNSTTILIISTPSNLTLRQTDALGSVIQRALSGVGGSKYYIAGSSAMSNQLASQSLSGMFLALFIGIVLSIIIVGLYFRSVVAAFLPLSMFGVAAISATAVNALLYKYVFKSSVSFITPTLLLILLLGLSSDYSVYIISRFKSELRKGNAEATVDASKWAGHAVFTSGVTVALSYIALWISNVPLFSDSGITNAIGVLLAVFAANTLLVSILHRARARIFWPSKIRPYSADSGSIMSTIAGGVIRNRGKFIVLFLVVTLIASYIYFSTPTNFDFFDLIPANTGVNAIKIVNHSFRGDFFEIGYVILKFQAPLLDGGTYNTTEMNALSAAESALLSHRQISFVYGPTMPYGQYIPYNLSRTSIPQRYWPDYSAKMNSYIGSNSHYALIEFQLSALAFSTSSTSFVSRLPSIIRSAAPDAYSIYIGGLTEALNNGYSYTSSSFTNMIPVLVIAILAVLAIQISSVFTPIRLIAMVLASVAISLSLTYVLIHYLSGLTIIIFLPMFTVITLLAVGLDYDIFMVTRVREEVIKGHTDVEGIRTSMRENGGVIITLGTVLFATFASLEFSGLAIIQEIGAGLALGVLIDTFISWPFFVPAVMLYLKRYNWWPSSISKTENYRK